WRGVADLRKLRAYVVPAADALIDNLFFQGDVEKRAGRGDSLVIHDVELSLSKRRCDFVFNDLDARSVPCHHTVGLLDRADAPNIDADTGVEFQGFSAGRRLRISK